MFVKIENFWLNTDQIVNLEPQGKSFRVNLSNGAFLVLRLAEYLILIKAMKIKSPVKPKKKPVRKPSYNRILTGERIDKPIPGKVKKRSL